MHDARAGLAAQLVAALHDERVDLATALAQLLLAEGLTDVELYEQVLQPALDDVGRDWAAGRLDVAQEHVVSHGVTVVLHRLAPPQAWPVRVVLACPPGERHLLGVTALGNVLRVRGVGTSVVGELPYDALAAHCRRQPALRLLGLSVCAVADVARLREDLACLQQALPGVRLVLGGLAVRRDPSLPAALGVDGVSGAAELLASLDALLPGWRT